MSYSSTVIVSFSLEDILESAIGVYTRGPKYSCNIRAEEILLSDWLKITSHDCFFRSTIYIYMYNAGACSQF